MKVLIISIFLLISILLESKEVKEYMVFNDGNGNNYIINLHEIEYQPVPMIMTNTGKFDNGNPKKVAITNQEYLKLEKLFFKVLADKENQSTVRPKGSYFLKKIKNKKTKSANLQMDYEKGEEILNILRDLISKKDPIP